MSLTTKEKVLLSGGVTLGLLFTLSGAALIASAITGAFFAAALSPFIIAGGTAAAVIGLPLTILSGRQIDLDRTKADHEFTGKSFFSVGFDKKTREEDSVFKAANTEKTEPSMIKKTIFGLTGATATALAGIIGLAAAAAYLGVFALPVGLTVALAAGIPLLLTSTYLAIAGWKELDNCRVNKDATGKFGEFISFGFKPDCCEFSKKAEQSQGAVIE